LSDTEHELLRDRDRAAKAKALLESPLFVEIMDGLEADLIEGWKKSPPNDTQGRERAWMAVSVLRNMRAILEKYEASGRFADRALDALHPNRL